MVNINIPSLNFGGQNNGNGFNMGGMSTRSLSPKASGWIVLLVGLVFAGLGAFALYDGNKTKDWPTTSGSIQNVSSRIDRDSDGNTETKYSYTVAYTVNGRSYDESETSSSYVTNGSQVKVAYNPNDPDDARIGNGPSWLGWIAIAAGVVAAIIGIGLLIKGAGGSKVNSLADSVPLQPTQPPASTPVVAPNPGSVTPPADIPTNPRPPLG